ncbi:CC/Se motif family (seleno)protein [Thermosinus carboxydivorans]|uniref:CC/Se motif family (seleno)protein n=1 Tax=Thermosinus carboxydivorans TaxID=261685 RepID=UPI0038CD2500
MNLGPSVRLGPPKNCADYEKQAINSIDVYIPKGFSCPFALTIEVGSFFGFKTLHIDGWKLI